MRLTALGHRPRKLIVEGNDDLHAIKSLMALHTSWPDDIHEAPLEIISIGGAEQILKAGAISGFLKEAATQVLGVIIDADESAQGRYDRLKSLLQEYAPDLPNQLPTTGVIAATTLKKTVGIWVMPNNRSDGELETMLAEMVSEKYRALHQFAHQSTIDAQQYAEWLRPEADPKPAIYATLAWCDPPGQSLGIGMKKGVFDARSSVVDSFVRWFLQLYNLDPLTRDHPPAESTDEG